MVGICWCVYMAATRVLAINIYIIVDCDTIGVCDSICISASSCASVARSMVVLPMPMVVLEEIGY